MPMDYSANMLLRPVRALRRQSEGKRLHAIMGFTAVVGGLTAVSLALDICLGFMLG
jgi:hypothetical protein